MTEQPQPPKEAAFFTAIRQWGLVRGADGVVGGVVSGLGARIGLAPIPARLLMIFAWILLPGPVMLAYAAGWGLLPDQQGNIIIQNFGRGVTNVGALIGIAVLTFFGFAGFSGGPIFAFFTGSSNWLAWDGPRSIGGGVRLLELLSVGLILLIVVGSVVGLVAWLSRRSKTSPTPPPGGDPSSPASASPGAHHGNTADAPVTSASDASAFAHAASTPPAVKPQPWELALLPGDPRAGVTPSPGAVRRSPHAGVPPVPPYSGPHPYPTTAPHTPAAAYVAPPRVPGPGSGAYLAFLAVLLISAAVVAGISRRGELAVYPVLAWGAAVTVGLGVILVVVAATGRKLGFLGLLSVVAVVLGVVFTGNAEEIRHDYAHRHDWMQEWSAPVDEVQEPEVSAPEHTPVDLTADLADDFSSVFIAGTCVTPFEYPSWSDLSEYGEPMATMRLDAVSADMSLDAVALNMRIAVPAGTSIEILGGDDVGVVWESRDTSCSTWSSIDYDDDGDGMTPSRPVLSMTNPDSPLLTINAETGTTIYLEEVVR